MIHLDFREFTQRVENWADTSKNKFVAEVNSQTSSGRTEGETLAQSVRERVYTDRDIGAPERVGFAFAKHGIYVHYGVGKGYRILDKGSGTVVKINPGEHKRKAVDWFNTPLQQQLDSLTKIAAEEYSKLTVAGLKIAFANVKIRGSK